MPWAWAAEDQDVSLELQGPFVRKQDSGTSHSLGQEQPALVVQPRSAVPA